MELKHHWGLFWKWKRLIILGVLLAGGVGYLTSRSATPVYQVDARLLVTPGSPQPSESYSSLVASERLAQTYAQLLQSEPLKEEALDRLGLPRPEVTPTGEARPDLSISAEPVRDTQLISLRVEGDDPQRVTEVANTLVDVFVEWQGRVQRSRYAESRSNLLAAMQRVLTEIEEAEAGIQALEARGEGADANEAALLQDQLVQHRNSYAALLNSHSNIELAEASSAATITVVSPAVRPEAPIRPRVMRRVLLAAVIGATLAVGAAFLIEHLDDTVRTKEDLQAVGLHLLAAVQQVNGSRGSGDEGLFAASQPRSPASESFRTLRTNLQFSAVERPLRSLVVTSAVPTEGKTTTAANLAVVMAQDGKRVVLVDADLRRSNMHRLFGLPNQKGLTLALVDDRAALTRHVRDTGIENLRVLTAGPIPPNPQEMLGSERMADLLRKLEEEADIVLVDTPPALVVADANLLASRVDGVLLVVNTGHTRHGVVEQAVGDLKKAGANVVGALAMDKQRRLVGGIPFLPEYERLVLRYAQERAQR